MQFIESDSSSEDEADLAEIMAGLQEFSAEIRSTLGALAGRHSEMEIDRDNTDEEEIDLGAESGEESADEDEYKSFKEDEDEEEEVEMEILDA